MVISVDKFSKAYKQGLRKNRTAAVQDLSFFVEAGEVFGLLGPNGAGKSTTIKALLNLIFIDSGKISIFGRPASTLSSKKNIGYLPENPCYYTYLTARELLNFGAVTSGVEKNLVDESINALLDKVELTKVADKPIKTYSKGMVQRAGLALALVHDPDLVILDEPMSGLDPLGRKLVGDLIIEMKNQGKTVMFSSHVLNDVERFCDRVGILVKGQLALMDSVANVLQHHQSLENAFVECCRQDVMV